jgi:hypothetical protein
MVGSAWKGDVPGVLERRADEFGKNAHSNV